jgi:hypothetical protein
MTRQALAFGCLSCINRSMSIFSERAARSRAEILGNLAYCRCHEVSTFVKPNTESTGWKCVSCLGALKNHRGLAFFFSLSDSRKPTLIRRTWVRLRLLGRISLAISFMMAYLSMLNMQYNPLEPFPAFSKNGGHDSKTDAGEGGRLPSCK